MKILGDTTSPYKSEDLESRLLYQKMFEQAVVGILCFALDGTVLRVNQQVYHMLGYSQKELAGLKVEDITYPEDIHTEEQTMRNLLEDKSSASRIERMRYVRKDGTLIWIKLAVGLMRLPTGEPQYFIAMIEDITAQIQAEEERAQLLEREQAARREAVERTRQLEAIFESLVDAVCVLDSECNVIQVNAAAYDILGLDRDSEYFRKPLDERVKVLKLYDESGQLLSKEQWPQVRVLKGESLQGKDSVDLLLVGPSGREVHVNLSGAPVRDQHNRVIGGVIVFRDITARYHLQLRIQKAFNTLLKLAEDLVHIPEHSRELIPPDYVYTDEPSIISPVLRAVGWRLVELTSQALECRTVGIALLDPESKKLLPVALGGLGDKERRRLRAEMYRSTLADYFGEAVVARLLANEVVLYDLTKHPPPDQLNYSQQKTLIAPMIIGKQLVGILTLEKKASEQDYTQEEIVLAKAAAKLILLVIERERIQQEWLEAHANERALQEANRRFDEFLSIASHELRTPLTTIQGNVQLALRRLRKIKRMENSNVQEVLGELDRIQSPLLYAEHRASVQNRMISDLLDVSRIRADKFELVMLPCDLVEVVREAVEDQRYAVPDRTITLELCAGETAPIIGDADRLGQVMHNYLSNALKYSPPLTPVEVRMERGDGQIRVSVHDQGPGLSPEEQEHIWERFYRVKGIEAQDGMDSGLGLGLHISRTIIEHHHGTFGLISAPGRGSTFWFTLPLASR